MGLFGEFCERVFYEENMKTEDKEREEIWDKATDLFRNLVISGFGEENLDEIFEDIRELFATKRRK